MTNTEINKRLCELLGVEWPIPRRIWDAGKFYYYCTDNTRQNDDPSGGQKDCSPCTKPCCPDFFSPAGRIDLLRRMREREDYADFINVVGQTYNIPDSKEFLIEDRFILDNTGSLARSAVKFLTKRSQCEEKYQRKDHNGMVGG